MEGDDPDRTWIMPKITARAAALTALLALALTGCAGTPDSASSEPAQAEARSTEVQPTEAEPTPEPTVEYTETEQIFLPWARENYADYRSRDASLPEMTDDDMLTALYTACAAMADGIIPIDTVVLPGYASIDELEDDIGVKDDANLLFVGAARNGYGAGITGTAGSYCP